MKSKHLFQNFFHSDFFRGYGPLNPLFSIAGLKVYEKRLAGYS